MSLTTSRDEIRAKVFASRPRSIKTIQLFGADVELRAFTVAELQKMMNEKSEIPPLAAMLIRYAYVPGTDEKVFDDADVAAIGNLETGKWVDELSTHVAALTGIDLRSAEKNSEGTTRAGQS